MKLVINDTYTLNNIQRVNEILEEGFPKRLVIIFPYSQNIFESIQNLFENEILTELKIIEDDKVLNIYTNYVVFFKLIHHQGQNGEFIELAIQEKESKKINYNKES